MDTEYIKTLMERGGRGEAVSHCARQLSGYFKNGGDVNISR